MGALNYHIREYYWLDLQQLNEIYRVTEFGKEVANRFNIYAESIPLVNRYAQNRGYCRKFGTRTYGLSFFALGNLMAILVSQPAERNRKSIMNLFDERSSDLIGFMPLKICFPAVEGLEWRIVTGSDPKNFPWSYHNGGNWPVLLWLFAATQLKGGSKGG